MKLSKLGFAPIIILSALIVLQACKAKKLAQKPTDTAKVAITPPPVQQPAPQPVAVTPPPPAPVKPDYNFSNIQFEFNSSVLKTESYPILDKAAADMKYDASIKFALKGFASNEGTAEHNLILSQDRANSVKQYLVNAGVSSSSLTAKGFGTKHPVADNSTEAGRVLNRRVEIHKLN